MIGEQGKNIIWVNGPSMTLLKDRLRANQKESGAVLALRIAAPCSPIWRKNV